MEEKKMSFYELFYIFIFGCVFGYVVEVLWSFYRHHIFINHTALVIGPFDIVYGISAMVLSLTLYKYRNGNFFKLLFKAFIIGTVLEYLFSLTMEKISGFVAWDYSDYFFNINGRVCLRYSIFWGLLGVLWIKYVYPMVAAFISKFNKVKASYLMYFLIVFMIFDVFLTFDAVDRAKEFEKGNPPRSRYEEYLDNHFGVEYLNNMYNNRWGKK